MQSNVRSVAARTIDRSYVRSATARTTDRSYVRPVTVRAVLDASWKSTPAPPLLPTHGDWTDFPHGPSVPQLLTHAINRRNL